MKQRLVSLQVLASPATRDWQRYKYLKIHFGLFELFCVKVASDMKKPNGQLVVAFNEEEVGKFARRLNIRKVALCFCLIKGA